MPRASIVSQINSDALNLAAAASCSGHAENGRWPVGFAATLSRAVVVLGEIQRPSGELFEPVGRVLS